MEPGAAVWVRDPGPETWVPGTILRKVPCGDDLFEMEVDLARGGKATFKASAGETEMPDLKLRNNSDVSLVEDLITLPHLHEPAILHSLWERFNQGDIYTFTGPILIAVNPFKRLPLYTDEKLMTYYEHGLLATQGLKSSTTLAPHVFAIADAAYRAMMDAIRNRPPAAAGVVGSQSILISGESGAGKTESTKVVMKYLTTVGAPAGTKADATDTVMQRVLQSNPILEAFGNARTIRNDNSSRFGKFIELHFDKRGHLLGASIQTYLLEKVRLPNQALSERNFHIFYQLCAGASDEDRARCRLGDVTEYHYTSQGQCFTLRHVDDRDEFALTIKAMATLGFSKDDQNAILEIIAGLLHLGQVTFRSDKTGEGSELDDDAYVQKAFTNASELIHLSPSYLKSTLTTRVVETRGESFTVNLKVQQAVDARDAISKALYGKLFNFIVAKINACIATDLKESRATVSVLDIFGFECFMNNSFEQLCINYCNEMLQQQFNQFVFKMEQEEYDKEGISWSFISFPDNQDCLDLIEGKPNGVLAMLDDECRLPKGSDDNYAGRLYKAYTQNKRFYVTNKMRPEFLFGIRHYAGEVAYNTAGFLEKNKDQLPKEAYNLFLSSDSSFIQDLFTEQQPPTKGGGPPGQQRRPPQQTSSLSITSPIKPGGAASAAGAASASVATQFKQQLNELMAKIHTTRPHYIRCLKPNDELLADKFHRMRVNEQLRYGGVLEAVRVARSGYPVRLPHPEFFSRYRCLATEAIKSITVEEPTAGSSIMPRKPTSKVVPIPHTIKSDNFEASRQWCQKVLDAIMTLQESQQQASVHIEKYKFLERESCQLGKTKVFLRKTAYEVLEFKRTSRLTSAAIKIQSVLRAVQVRREYIILRAATCRLQRVVRGMQGRKVARSLRWNRASLKIQAAYRGFHVRHRYRRSRWAVLRIQSRYRGQQARKVVRAMMADKAAFKIEKWYRMATTRRKYKRWSKACVALQCGYRMRVAKQELRKLRLEAKDIGNLKANEAKLKEEVAKLKMQLDRKAEENRLEKERQVAEERMAAAKAVMEELETWKEKYYQLEKTYLEEKGERENLEQRLEVVVSESKQKDIMLASEKETAQKYEELCRRLQADMGRYEADMEALQKQLHQAKAAAAAAFGGGGGGSNGHLANPRRSTSVDSLPSPTNASHSRSGSLDRSGHQHSVTTSHKILDSIAGSPRNGYAGGGGSGKGSFGSQRSGSIGSDATDDASAAVLDSSEYKTDHQQQQAPSVQQHDDDDTGSGASSSQLAATSEQHHQQQQHAEAKVPDDQPPSRGDAAEVEVEEEVGGGGAGRQARLPSNARSSSPPPPPSSSSSTDKLSLSSRGSSLLNMVSPGRARRQSQQSQQPTPSIIPPSDFMLQAPGGNNRRASLTIRNMGGASNHFSDDEDGELEGDELDDIVDLEDKEQEVNKHTVRRNRQEALEKLCGKLRNFRPDVGAGIDVKVLEIGRSTTFVPMKMKLVDCTGSDEDVVKGRVVFEGEKPKKSLLGGWFQGDGGAGGKGSAVPDPVKLSELYGVVRGYRRVRWAGGPAMEASVVDDQHKLLTLITLETPQDDSRRRGIVIMFEKREQRNHMVEGLRRLIHELLFRSTLAPSTPTLASHAIQVKGYAFGQVVPFERVQQLVGQSRADCNAALAELIDATNDLTLMEEEIKTLEHERKRLEGEIHSKEVELQNVQGEFEKVRAERFKLARTSNEQMSEIAELKEEVNMQRIVHSNMQKAMGAQWDEEKTHYDKRLESEKQVNKELQDKMLKVQMENVEHKDEIRKLRELKEHVDAMLKEAKAELHDMHMKRGGERNSKGDDDHHHQGSTTAAGVSSVRSPTYSPSPK